MRLSYWVSLTVAVLLAACTLRPPAADPAGAPVPSPTAEPRAGGAVERPPALAMQTTPEPSSTPAPSPSPSPAPSATPTPTPTPVLRQLTSGGCCWNPFFIGDQVVFLDRPAPDAPVGYYAVSVEGGPPTLLEPRVGVFLHGGAYITFVEGGMTVIERRSDGTRWVLDTQSQSVILSPDAAQVAWSLREESGPYDQRRAQIWRANLDGSNAHVELELFGGGLAAWLPGDRWLLVGRFEREGTDRQLMVYDLNTKTIRELFRAQRLSDIAVSPDGAWVLFIATRDPVAERNGLWAVRTDGTEQRLPWFGAYAWRDNKRVFYFPYAVRAESHQVWEYDVETGESRPLTDPAVTPFKIAQGNFDFSDDGRMMAFVSASDLNIWLLILPP